MFKKIFTVLIVIILAFILVAALQPDDFRVTRSITISAPASAAFAQVNDFHNWTKWSPWEKMDPAIKQTYDGPSAGTGAVYAWAGDAKVGEGRMTITESRPNELIRIKLEFIKPFQAVNTSEFTFKPEGNQTSATWSMYGKNNFMSKAMSLIMNCDKMIGGQFEQGLAQLKSVAEGATTP